VKEHPDFKREGNDIIYEKEVPFHIAVMGGKVKVPTLDGEKVLKIPSGTQSGTTFKMRGKGMPYLHSYGEGDQYVITRVAVPEKYNRKQKKLLEELEKEGLFD
jgi:molecular chaperone DnaJ